MKLRARSLLLAIILVSTPTAGFAETLPNGIELPDSWPPYREAKEVVSGEPMPVPYLTNPPAIIPIDLGRQLLVDDFLIEESSLTRTFHRPEYHPANPVFRPEAEWEKTEGRMFAAPYSDGVWYDPEEGVFKMWYRAANGSTCLALSSDGLSWTRPELEAFPGTNALFKSNRDTVSVWLNPNAKDPARRFVAFEARWIKPAHRLHLRFSPDGREWTDDLAISGPSWDRSSVFWNPFRRLWVASVRGHDRTKPDPVHRSRNYHEGKTPESVLAWTEHTDEVSQGVDAPGGLQPWVAADRLDPRHPDPRFRDYEPQLYNLDVFSYESLLVGLFTIWQGPDNATCKELGIHKRNEVLAGFTRDGFHWDRPDRTPFLPVSEDPKAWNSGNVQSVCGGCVIVGDFLYFYCSGRTMHPSDITSTGLATLRRDGFASLDSESKGGTMTTRPLKFSGKRLFVNLAAAGGELRVEALDQSGQVIEPFTLKNCIPLSGDATAMAVQWNGVNDLTQLSGQPVRFRFSLKNGSLYSFWVSPAAAGG
ncbi:MAG: hypothetical protein ACI8UO_004281 [Verrucomicrobiales bacterium]